MLLEILLTTGIISAIPLLSIISLSVNKKLLNNILILLVSLSAGALLGGALFHLIPEAFEMLDIKNTLIVVFFGITCFFIIEKVLHWRHCHNNKCDKHPFGYINLIGDSIHNFLDGLIIAASFVSNTGLGITTTLAIAMHEVPQEIGDFGVLLYSGMKKNKAIMFNLLVALTAFIGGLTGYFLANFSGAIMMYLVPFAAGGFIYTAASDLLPEVIRENNWKKWILSFILFLAGAGLMLLMGE